LRLSGLHTKTGGAGYLSTTVYGSVCLAFSALELLIKQHHINYVFYVPYLQLDIIVNYSKRYTTTGTLWILND
jgi:hypothetical protein